MVADLVADTVAVGVAVPAGVRLEALRAEEVAASAGRRAQVAKAVGLKGVVPAADLQVWLAGRMAVVVMVGYLEALPVDKMGVVV